jgi:protein-S-isoprenylcysteine O-methyltransferase Ste14
VPSQLDLKIPPAVVLLAAMAAMRLTALLAPGLDFDFPRRMAAAGLLALAGIGVALAGILALRARATTINPIVPSDTRILVISGIYGWTRNPMYLGLCLALASWGLVLGNFATLAWIPAMAAYLQRFQIQPEERTLARLFGRDYEAYLRKVRRWL